MKTRFGVITRLGTTLADDFAIRGTDGLLKMVEGGDEITKSTPIWRIKVPVYVLGEILVLDEYGREVGGHGRKPSKWDVTCEEFDSLDDAIKRMRELDYQ